MTSTQEKESTTSTVSTHHHHHHHHHHVDESEVTKKRALRSIKIKNETEKILFFVLTMAAIAIVAFVYWIYTTE